MEITVDERTQRAVDTAMRYFLQVHRAGTIQDTETVCAYVQKVLYDRHIEVDYQYLELLWHELLSQGPEPQAKKGPSVEERRTIGRKKWEAVRERASEAIRSLPPVPAEYLKAVEDCLTNPDFFAGAFAYNGRAIDNTLKSECKADIMRLEKRGLVKRHKLDVTVEDKKGKVYTVYYWEPAAGSSEEPPKETENKCLKGEEELNRLDTEIGEGAEVYLKDATWGDKNGKK
jgi:hypothetical protein